MLVEGTVPVQPVECRVATDDPAEAVRQFKLAYPKARVELIEGNVVRGVCKCGQPVMEHTTGYAYDPDEERYICPQCLEKKA